VQIDVGLLCSHTTVNMMQPCSENHRCKKRCKHVFIFKFKNAFLTLFYFPNDNQLVQQIAQVAPETRNSQEWM